MQLQEETILLDQSLHGYADGHRLLASSMPLSKAATRTMLVLSDLSGSSPLRGFECYLTGYPLLDEGIYAFARTWYAHEMERPGCVWTHTLLIRNEDLPRIPSAFALLPLFQRPTRSPAISEYEERVRLEVPLSASHDALPFAAPRQPILFVHHVLSLLYDAGECPPVFLVSDSADDYESLVISLWSQQWAGLRSRFSFCSGSLSHRSIDNKEFDLQVVPRRTVPYIEREVAAGRFASQERLEKSSDSADHVWLDTATQDLLADSATSFRCYLQKVGDELNPHRSDFQKLAKVYGDFRALANREMRLADLISRIGESFPKADEGARLKAVVIGPDREEDYLSRDPSVEASLLCALAETDQYRAFSPELLQLRSRASAAWRRKDVDFYACVRQLIVGDVSPLGSELLAGIADVIRPSELTKLAGGDNRLVFMFAERNPSLACASELWIGTPDYQHELFDHVKHASMTPEMTRAMLIAMFEACADSVAFDTYHHSGSLVVRVFLDWCNDHPQVIARIRRRRWIEVLGEAPEETLEWLKGNSQPKPQTVALIVSELDPRSSVVQRYGTGVWQKALDVVECDRDADSSVRRILAEFLLPYSLATPQPGSARLAEFSFPIIHQALATNSLSYEAWRRLDPILPRLSWPHSWDKCERLRRGMKEAGFAVTMRESEP